MDWSNERYVRVYTRDTTNWSRFRWEGQTLLMHLLRKVDRSGCLEGIENPVEDVALVTGLPEEIVERGLNRLMKPSSNEKHATVVIKNNVLVVPNHMEAQETPFSDAERQRRSREKKRAEKLGVDVETLLSDSKAKPEKPKKKQKNYTTEVLQIWEHTPPKGKERSSKKQLQTEWDKVRPKPDIELVLKRLDDFCKSEEWQKKNGQYVKGIHLWVNARKWEVEIPQHDPKSQFDFFE